MNKRFHLLLSVLFALVLCTRILQGSSAPTVSFNNPSPNAGDEFGWAVAVAGKWVVVGADFDDTGATNAGVAYVYDIASSMPNVPLFTLTNPTPSEIQFWGEEFGSSVAIGGTQVIIGAPSDRDAGADRAGAVYIYDLGSATPTMPAVTLTGPNPSGGETFGRSVAVAGTRVVVGAPGNNTGTNGAGAVYVFDLASAAPTDPVSILTNPHPSRIGFQTEGFGESVAIFETKVVVAAPYEEVGGVGAVGVAYVFDLTGGTPTVPMATLRNPRQEDDEYGISVAIEGSTVVVGTENHYEVYIFDLSSATPEVPVVTLVDPTPAPFEGFGISVALSGTRVIVGASDDNVRGIDVGRVYVYDLTSARPTVPLAILDNPAPAHGDEFGRAVGVNGVRIVVGAPYDNGQVVDSGAAYVFTVGPMMRMVKESPGVLKLSWTPADPDFVLQCADRLGPDRWRDYGTGPITPVTILTTNQLPFYRLVAAGPPGFVINEVDYDQIGTDSTEFVELFNGSTTTRDLSQYAVVFINGASSNEYLRVTLSGTLAAGEYLVVASTNLPPIPPGVRRIDLPFSDNNIQNGAPDGIALVFLPALQVVDALSYEGGIRTASINGFPGRYNLVEGRELPISVQDSNTVAGSLGRSPNGGDTNDAATDWRFLNQPSPGSAN
jgi:hypothetical protein